MIKGFNLCENKNSYFLGSKGLTRDYLPYSSTILGFETTHVHRQQGRFKSTLYGLWYRFRHPLSKGSAF